MGRLPGEFGNRKITFRVPFNMPGELVLDGGQLGLQFPEATFLHNQDKPFEIHRLIPRVTALDVNNLYYVTLQPSLDALFSCTRLRIFDVSKNENLTKNAQLLSTLCKGTNERSWEFAEPYTLVRSEGLQITVDNLGTAAIFGGVYSKSRIEITFQGFLIQIAPPTADR